MLDEPVREVRKYTVDEIIYYNLLDIISLIPKWNVDNYFAQNTPPLNCKSRYCVVSQTTLGNFVLAIYSPHLSHMEIGTPTEWSLVLGRGSECWEPIMWNKWVVTNYNFDSTILLLFTCLYARFLWIWWFYFWILFVRCWRIL